MFNLNVPEFVPHRLLSSGHAQTIFSAFFGRPLSPLDATCHLVDAPDGDRLVLHDSRPEPWQIGDRQVLLLHGLCGCHESAYMVRTARRLFDQNIRCWRLDARGCGAGVRLAKNHHHAGRIEDLQVAIEAIQRQSQASPVSLIGYSLGGNLVLNWLASDFAKGNVDSAIAVAPPIDLWHCANNLQSGLGRLYDSYFARVMRDQFLRRRKLVPDLNDRPVNPLPRRIIHFDDHLTAPLAGFGDVFEYYRQCSSGPKLERIGIPTLIVADQSDPVIPFDVFQRWPMPSCVQVYETRHGGHLGYVAKSSDDLDRQWLVWRICDWMMQLNRNQ